MVVQELWSLKEGKEVVLEVDIGLVELVRMVLASGYYLEVGIPGRNLDELRKIKNFVSINIQYRITKFIEMLLIC